jgi:uncharacterized protein YjeT (DUF2065 family)
MPANVLFVDVFGLVLAAVGFTMAFRPKVVRSLFHRSGRPDASAHPIGSSDDPLTYVLRIAGIMVMAFGIVFAGMMTMVHLAQS